MPQLRQNIITGEWVVIAPERAKRPSDFVKIPGGSSTSGESEPAYRTGRPTPEVVPPKDCVFCVGGVQYEQRNRELETEIIYLIRNKFPVFVPEEGMVSPRSFRTEDEFYLAKAALGDSDVVIIKDHQTNLFHFSPKIWNDLFSILSRRYQMLKAHPAITNIMTIYNHGPEAGASIGHPHAQILSSSVVTNSIKHELDGAGLYFESNGACVFCDLARHEEKERTRVIAENEHAIAFTFYAARFPFEMWLVPKRHQSQFEEESAEVLVGVAEVLQQALAKLAKTLQEPSVNFFIHSLPTTQEESTFYHWHIEIAPRVSLYGGYELGSGVVIDVVSPEKAAEFLRETASHHGGLD